jgi:nucleoside-diphosphate-sugar epimerase
MNIIIFGAFGVVGKRILEILPDNINIRCFDIKNTKTKKVARKFKDKCEIIWGDIRDQKAVEVALENQDIIIHLAYILPPITDDNYHFAKSVNIGGTKNILKAAVKESNSPKIIFASSVAAYGDTRNIEQPITIDTPLKPLDNYAEMKVESMKLIKSSGLQYSIFVLGVVLDVEKLTYDPKMFEVPKDTNIEIIHPVDAAKAFVHALSCEDIWNKTWHISGGVNCRIHYLDFIIEAMDKMGLGKLPEKAFGGNLYHSSFMDSESSNAILKYQNNSYHEILDEIYNNNRLAIFFIKLFRPIIRYFILRKSPFYKR